MIITEKLLYEMKSIEYEQYLSWLFYGSNIGLCDYLCNKIVNKINFDEKIIIECNSDTDGGIKELESNLYGDGLFGNKKAIKIYNPTKKVFSVLSEVIESNRINNLFIFIIAGDAVDNKSAIKNLHEKEEKCATIACYEDDEAKVRKEIKDYINKNHLELEVDNILPFVIDLKFDRMLILSELDKLVISNKKDPASLEQLLKHSLQEMNFSSFVDNFLIKNATIAVKNLDILINQHNVNVIQIVRIALDHLHKLKNIKLDIQSKKLSQDLAIKTNGIFFQRVNYVKKQIMINDNEINKIIKNLLDIEIKAKTFGEDIAIPFLYKMALDIQC